MQRNKYLILRNVSLFFGFIWIRLGGGNFFRHTTKLVIVDVTFISSLQLVFQAQFIIPYSFELALSISFSSILIFGKLFTTVKYFPIWFFSSFLFRDAIIICLDLANAQSWMSWMIPMCSFWAVCWSKVTDSLNGRCPVIVDSVLFSNCKKICPSRGKKNDGEDRVQHYVFFELVHTYIRPNWFITKCMSAMSYLNMLIE